MTCLTIFMHFTLRTFNQISDKVDACGDNVALMTADSGFIQHPSVFDGSYRNNENCTWHVSAPEDKVSPICIEI